MAWIAIVMILAITFLSGCEEPVWAESFITEASYYTYTSCIKEGTSGICANGERMDDEALTAASWDYKFGTTLRVTNQCNGRSVLVRVNDRGPSKKLYRKGRKIDLSLKAAKELKMVKSGLATVLIEVVK